MVGKRSTKFRKHGEDDFPGDQPIPFRGYLDVCHLTRDTFQAIPCFEKHLLRVMKLLTTGLFPGIQEHFPPVCSWRLKNPCLLPGPGGSDRLIVADKANRYHRIQKGARSTMLESFCNHTTAEFRGNERPGYILNKQQLRTG